MSGFKNARKTKFINQLPDISLDDRADRLSTRCKFNFHYLDFSQAPPGHHFKEWEKETLIQFFEKIKYYSGESLQFWKNQYLGGRYRHSVLEVYDRFPLKSDYIHPKNVPIEVRWARFRLEAKVRLVGFIVPEVYQNKEPAGYRFDSNTFYVVFLDWDHRFYKTSKK